ncbi:hypothetical protein Tco_0427487 [Tanacetum coccineum]
MANFATKHSIMTQKMVDSFWNSFYIPAEVHPTAPGRGKTISEFLAGKVGVYTRIFDVCGYRITFTKFFMAVLKYFHLHISQLSPFGAARVSHFEVLTRVLDLALSVALFRAFYTRSYSDRLFLFAKRSTSAPTCFSKPPDSIKNWADYFFCVDSRVFPISVPLYTGGTLEKDPAPHLTTRQEQAVKLLESHKAPFRQYPECFLCLVGLSPYYPFDENSYPAFEYPDGTEMGLFDFIKTADPRKVQAVEVQKGADQVKLLESTEHCFMPLVPRAPGGSSSAAGAEVSALVEERLEDVAADDAYLELVDPGEDTVVVRRGEEEVVTEQPKKIKKTRLIKRSDVLPAKKLRTEHPSLASCTRGKTLAGLEQIMPAGSRLLAREQSATPSVAPPSQESESFVDLSTQASPGSVLQWGVVCIRILKYCRCLPQLPQAWHATDFNPDLASPSYLRIGKGLMILSMSLLPLTLPRRSVGMFLGGTLPMIRCWTMAFPAGQHANMPGQRLKSQLAEKEAEAAEVVRLRNQVFSLSGEKSALTAEVSALKVTITQKDHDISLLDSLVTHLESALNDAQVACTEAGTKITSLASERDRLVSEVSSLRAGFEDFKEKMEVQQEEQAQELYNRVAELEARVMDVFVRRLGAGQEQVVPGEVFPMVDAYNPEAARASYVDAVKALEDASFPLVDLLKSKKDAGMDEVLDCFLLDGPLAGLLEAA